ncbi:ThuA domain-containing protein [Pendulispora brunnea]|uniref:ThuA domain-containing protein n=1 Tax=Pendulispora brunnea TaxID=2905690 RepID=A0ABZ2K807_9BACT
MTYASALTRRSIRPAMLLAIFVTAAGCGSDGSGEANATASAVDDTGSNLAATPKVKVLSIGQLKVNGEDEIHAPFVNAATTWLKQIAPANNLEITFVESPNGITDAVLSKYNMILQLNYVPWGWNRTAQAAFEKYISEGRGGWVGLHHAGLYGPEVQPETEPLWTWYGDFLGKINYQNYIASFAEATVRIEDRSHPIFAGVPAKFQVTKDEWYTWDKSPRPNVHVLANVDENSYKPPSDIKMGGDHPVVWSNPKYRAKNVYIFMGHHPNLMQNTAYKTLLKNAIVWAGTPKR